MTILSAATVASDPYGIVPWFSVAGVLLVFVIWGILYSAYKRSRYEGLIGGLGGVFGIALALGGMFLLPFSVGAIVGMAIGVFGATFGNLFGRAIGRAINDWSATRRS